jgi:hypothetical protein
VFTASKGLTGVGFPQKGSGRGANKTTGWEDIAAVKRHPLLVLWRHENWSS